MDSISLKEEFKRLLEDPNFVCVENFYEKMEEINKTLIWKEKGIDIQRMKKFNDLVENYDPKKLELYAEGVRCLAQIHINLLKDFDIFKIYPIRKYSSAYNYISKIDGFEEILKYIGYEEREGNKYKLKDNMEKIDEEKKIETFNTAFELLISFMELSEIIKIRYDMCETKDLIIQREKNLKENFENEQLSKMTEEEKWDKFKKCEVCDNEMDMEKGTCEVCLFPISEFSFAYKFKDIIEKKYDVKIVVPNDDILPDNHLDQSKAPKGAIERTKSDEKWACTQCTFANEPANINCLICECKRN